MMVPRATVTAVCRALYDRHEPVLRAAGIVPGHVEDAASFVCTQLRAAPAHLRAPVTLLCLLLNFAALLRFGRRFGRASGEQRSALLLAWSASGAPRLRQFVRFFETLVVYDMTQTRRPLAESPLKF